MASTPWTVTSKKRKSTPAPTFSGRKRQRRDDTPSAVEVRQQTLTQASWVSRPNSSLDEDDMTAIDTPRPRKAKKARKQKSTLTQIGFVETRSAQELDKEDLIKLSDEHEGPKQIPQYDGPYQSPRRQRPRKKLPVLKTKEESQEYHPSNKSRKSAEDGFPRSSPRRSTRKKTQPARVLSDPADSNEYFAQALEGHLSTQSYAKKVPEIHDSTGGDTTPLAPTKSPDKAPRTPSRSATRYANIDEIKSSQSPESLPPSARRSARSQSRRLPLGELSGNARLEPTPPHVHLQKPSDACTKPTTSKLKRPPKTPKDRIEDSQGNLWSLHATSSPEKEVPMETLTTEMALPPIATVSKGEVENNPIEIPSTSQIERELHTDSQPDELNVAAQALATHNNSYGVKAPLHADHQNIEVADNDTNDLGPKDGIERQSYKLRRPSSALNKEHVARPFLDGTPQPPNNDTPRPLDRRGSFVDDSDSEFGSPIRNNTQFNEEVKQRTSSPLPSDEVGTAGDEDGPAADTLPTPRLVQHSPATHASRNESDSSSDSVSLPAPPTVPGFTTRRVPLNDIVPSSSQSIPSTKSATQRSAHPASMPHPSQISTQEATQGYFGSSSMPTETPRATQRITIKDSSSAHVPMSQIPQQQASQSQLNIDFGLDDQDNYEDYDLDPPTSTPRPRTDNGHAVHQPPEIPTERILPSSSSPSPRPHRAHQPPIPNPQTYHSPPRYPSQHSELPSSPRRGPSPPAVHDPPSATSPTKSNIPDTADKATRRRKRRRRSPSSSPPLPLDNPLSQYTPLPGFNNDTQSDFTQNGSTSAAYVHRQRQMGVLPKWYVPKPVRVPGYTKK